MNISLCCPSYRRPIVETLRYLPQCRVYVDPGEIDAYRGANRNADIVACDPGIQGNLCRVRNHIIDRELANGADAVVIVDDDMRKIGFFENGKQHRMLAGSDIMPFLEKYTIMARDLGAYLWGININSDPQCYREYIPFSTVSYIGGPFQAILRGNVLRYDERLPLKEDYDYTLQNLNHYRVVLRINKFHYVVRQSEQAGGCATYRNLEKEREQFELLRKKWGSRIVSSDHSDRSHKARSVRGGTFDYNPIIRPPISGL